MKKYTAIEAAIKVGYTEAWVKHLVRKKVIGVYENGEYALSETDIEYLKRRKPVLNGGGQSMPKYLKVKMDGKNGSR
jgi:hypothetical protein